MYRVIISAAYNIAVAIFGVCVIIEVIANLLTNTAFPKGEIAVVGIIMTAAYALLQYLALVELQENIKQIKKK